MKPRSQEAKTKKRRNLLPLNIPTPIPAPDHLRGGHEGKWGTRVDGDHGGQEDLGGPEEQLGNLVGGGKQLPGYGARRRVSIKLQKK